MRNVALVGNMAAGKTTLATALVNEGFERISFAGLMKEMFARAYGDLNKGQEYSVTNQDGSVTTKSAREILQGIGQYIKHVDRNFWIKVTLNDIAGKEGPFVNEDTRFMFEAQALRDEGWLIVGISTPDDIRIERYKVLYGREPRPEELNHESEVEVPAILKEADILVDGTGDVNETIRNIISAATGT